MRLSGDHAALRLIEFYDEPSCSVDGGFVPAISAFLLSAMTSKGCLTRVIALMEDIEISKRLNGFSKPFVIRLPVCDL